MVVTAARYEKKDVDIAASTDVITREQLDSVGATNVYEALLFSTNLTVDGKAPGGAAFGSMTSKIAIRGSEKGTLVMMNGTPINFRGLYSIDSIPTDIVERIEIVRGGGAVLYGSEASGGVINIITKKDADQSSVRVGFGKQSRQNHSIDIHAGRLGVNYTYDKWGHVGFISDSKAVNASKTAKNMSQDFLKSELHNGTITYKFSDNVDALVRHSVRNSYTNYTFNDPKYGDVNGKPRYWRDYETNETFAQVNFKDNHGFKGNVFYNRNELKTDGKDYYSSTGGTKGYPKTSKSFERNLTSGIDLQKLWENGKNNYLIGLSAVREFYKDDDLNYSRTVSSIYGSWDTGIGSKNLFTLSARGTKVTGAKSGKNYSNFSGQAAVFVVVQTLQDMVLVPRIMGKVTGLGPAAILLSLSVWGALMGVIGMIVALPLTTLAVSCYKHYVLHEPFASEQSEAECQSKDNNRKSEDDSQTSEDMPVEILSLQKN